MSKSELQCSFCGKKKNTSKEFNDSNLSPAYFDFLFLREELLLVNGLFKTCDQIEVLIIELEIVGLHFGKIE